MEVGKEKREAETGKGMTKVEKARGKVEEQVEEEETGRKRLLDQDGGGEVNEKRRKDSRDEEDQEAESANQPPEQIMIDGGQREECRNGAKRMKECDGGRHARDDGKEEREFVEELARKYFLLLLKKYPACFSQARGQEIHPSPDRHNVPDTEGARKDNRGKHMQLPENREKMNRVVRPVQASESLYEKFKPAGDSAVERALQKQVCLDVMRSIADDTTKAEDSKSLCQEQEAVYTALPAGLVIAGVSLILIRILLLQNSLLQHEILSGPGTTHEFQEILWDKSKSFFGWTGFLRLTCSPLLS
eukprot:756977-Hanusia_phi.AAC.1